MKKRNVVIFSVVLIVIASATFIIISNYNKQFVKDRYYFNAHHNDHHKERYIEIPGRCKLLEPPFSGFCLETDKSTDEVLKFYDNYTKDREQITTNVGTGYFIESANLIIFKYEAFENQNGKTCIVIDYEEYFKPISDS
ncbi:MAG: hypothetical protein PHV95_05040 [Eubacteriales bacterium]|nr:hypothetical protein [Eubacteriales bacterium]